MSFARRWFIVLVLVATASCGGDSQGSGPAEWPAAATTGTGTPIGNTAVATIGAAGGTLMSEDSRVSLTIPAGALSADVQVGIQRISAEAPSGVRAYRLTPDGQTFAAPITVQMRFDSALTAGSAPELMTIATQLANGTWELLRPSAVTLNSGSSAFDFQTTHFSDYTMLQGLQIRPPSDSVDEGESVTLTVENCTTIIETAEGEYSSYAIDCDDAPRPPAPDGEDDLPPLPTFSVRGSTWSVNGKVGGDQGRGTVSGGRSATYHAPNPLNAPNPVAVSVKVHSNHENVDYTLVSHITVRTFCPAQGVGVSSALRADCRPPNLSGSSASTITDATPLYDISGDIEWVYDSSRSIPGQIETWFPRGSATFTSRDPCIQVSPSSFSWDLSYEQSTGSLTVSIIGSDSTWTGFAGIVWTATYTDLCDQNEQPTEGAAGGAYFAGNGRFTGAYNFSGTQSIGGQTFTYSFSQAGAGLRQHRNLK